MRYKIGLILLAVIFVVFCGFLIARTGHFEQGCPAKGPCIVLQQKAPAEEQVSPAEQSEEAPKLQTDPNLEYITDEPEATSVTIGSIDPASGFELELKLNSKGASIEKATFSRYDDRDHEDPQPLNVLTPMGDVFSMANKEFMLVEQDKQLPLHKENWNNSEVETLPDGSKVARFDMTIYEKTAEKKAVIKITKSYKIVPGSFLLYCNVKVDNLTDADHNVKFNLAGPTGIGREDVGYDMRNAIACFRDSKGEIVSSIISVRKFKGGQLYDKKPLSLAGGRFLWAGIANKYFAAVVIPVPEQGKNFCDWVTEKDAYFQNPDGEKNSGDENIGVNLKIASSTLAAGESRDYQFHLYLGPKDKKSFDTNEYYREIGLVNVIDFMACCCPAAMIRPLAFGILAVMEWLYKFIPNYGVVIIILVFLIRLIIHPLTKKSQVSMSKMSGMAPKVEELKKKYANNKAELNKHMMALYKEQGASPVMGMLPMLVQMPVWIALYSAINASLSLRGAAFLPFWITDLSAPDALFRFSTITIPFVKWHISSFNLLPILMGIAFYLQQKLMPKSAAASTNPQLEQQQKMMMIMMPIMFPLMLYSRPSGLNLYIMASTFAGVFEQYVIRKHIREKEEAESQGLVAVTSKTGGKTKKKKPKPFFRQYH